MPHDAHGRAGRAQRRDDVLRDPAWPISATEIMLASYG